MAAGDDMVPITRWGGALHDPGLAEAGVDRAFERGQLSIIDGPLHRTRHRPDLKLEHSTERARNGETGQPRVPGLAEVRSAIVFGERSRGLG